MRKLLDIEGPVFGFLEKTGQLILLSVLWLLGSLPGITLCTSCAALYHGVTQSVRRGLGNAVKAFCSSFRKNLVSGMVHSVILVGALAGLECISIFLLHSVVPTGVVCVLMILDLFVLLYAGPVNARFHMGVLETLKLSFVLSLQYAHHTFVFLIGTLALTVLQVYVFPMAMVLFLPGVWCLVISFLMEKALNRYAPVHAGMEDEMERA